MNRKELVEGIYEKRKHLYKDVCHLYRPNQIGRRIVQLSRELKAIPPKKKFRRGNHYRTLLYEFQLLKAKLACLSADTAADKPYYMARGVIEQADLNVRNKERVDLSKERQTKMLLHFVMGKYSDEKLRTMLEG